MFEFGGMTVVLLIVGLLLLLLLLAAALAPTQQDLMRELRMSPMLQLGVNYSF